MLTPPRVSNSSRISVILFASQLKDNRILYLSHFFPVYYEAADSFMNPLFVLYQPAMTVSDTRWHLLNCDVFLIDAVFCGHKRTKMSFTELLVAFTDQRWPLTIHPLVTTTVPRYCLQIRGCQLGKTHIKKSVFLLPFFGRQCIILIMNKDNKLNFLLLKHVYRTRTKNLKIFHFAGQFKQRIDVPF